MNYNKLNQKGAATIITTMVYLLISFAILAMVTVSAMDLLSKSKEQANYNAMLDSFDRLDLALNDSISNKQEIDIIINNPDEIEIDCTNNQIIGRVKFEGNYRTDETIINDIITYKKNDFIYFEKDITNLGNVAFNCKNTSLSKGKNNLIVNYFEYDETTKTISLDISKNTKDHNGSWYNSNWAYRKKIIIDHTTIDEDLTNFPLLLKINPITDPEGLTEEEIKATTDLSYSKSDGSGLVFTTDDGKTKLKREIESITAEGVLPYYIEETGGQRFVWTKVTLGPYETREVVITKTLEDLPDGDLVFDFFDDFDGSVIDDQKWGYSQTLTSTGVLSLSANPGNLTSNRSFIVSKNPIPATNKIYKVRYRSERVASVYDNGFIIMGRDYDKSCYLNSGLQFGNNLLYDSEYNITLAYSCTSTGYSVYRSGTDVIAPFGVYLNYEAIVNENNSQVKQIVYSDTGTVLNDSGWISPTASYLRSDGFLALNTYNSTTTGGRVRYDYVFVRQNVSTEPTVTTTKIGNQYKVTITNNLNQTLTDYQIKIPAEDLEVYSKNRSLQIIDLSFSPNSNELVAWIKVPKISSTEDTIFYMYYGNPNGEEENDKDVWDNDYVMVQHLNETPINNVVGFFDSTANGNNGTAKGFDNINSSTNAIGKIAGANKHTIVLDGVDYPSTTSSNYVDFGTIYNDDWNYQTVSMWINWDGTGNGGYALIYGDARYSNFGRFLVNGNVLVQNQASGNSFNGNTLPANQWTHVVYRYNSDENKEYIFINGQKEEKERTQNITYNSYPLLLGYADWYAFSGYIDEFKVSEVSRSDSWIKAEYNNQNNLYSFYSFGLTENQ